MAQSNLITTPSSKHVSARPITHRTRGRGHGDIFRLMSPGDLGALLKPFVFLDIFAGNMSELAAGANMHPHSGIATVTVFTEGDVRFDDATDGHGYLGYGGVEWMRAGAGVWHGKELSSGRSQRMSGFQLWIALPAELELAQVQSQYIEASAMKQAGPAYVILGRHEGVESPVRSPEGLNYLLVTLAPFERWTYAPAKGHEVGWLALAKGELVGDAPVSAGELAIFQKGEGDITVRGGAKGATFVLGSAAPHPHDLHLGYYSVHTSRAALAAGERKILELREALLNHGNRSTAVGSQPIFRG